MFSELGSGLSGPASVPFTIAAMFVSSHTQKVLYGSLAAILACFAAYRVWAREHERAERAIAENGRPKLDIDIRALFWEPEKQSSKPYFFFRVFAYVCVTNTNKPETLLKDAVLSFTASDGIQYISERTEDLDFKYIGHGTNFRAGGEVEDEHRMHTPYHSLVAEVNGENPLRQGIHRLGCLAFAFPDLQNPDASVTEMISGKDVNLALIDSYGQRHSILIPSAEIAAGRGTYSLARVRYL
jgi:hypothetical protein